MSTMRGESLEEIDLDGHVDARGIRYIGSALRQANGKYVCLADVKGCLCHVECTISLRGPNDARGPDVTP